MAWHYRALTIDLHCRHSNVPLAAALRRTPCRPRQSCCQTVHWGEASSRPRVLIDTPKPEDRAAEEESAIRIGSQDEGLHLSVAQDQNNNSVNRAARDVEPCFSLELISDGTR